MASVQTSQTISVFIDSSVLIAAAISTTGAGRELILRALAGDVQLYLSDLVLEETERNLARKAPAALGVFQIFRQLLAANVANPSQDQVSQVAQLIAVKDAPIVAAAIQAGVGYLATYDRRHLLSQKEQIRTHFGVMVVTPDEVLAIGR